ncbi:hypothetical protein AVCANL279_01000 [Campylobacter canadensis]|uniref:hypothetical protein n=1 Tax=Campylobacter canadensis TaxID=449520 RepID=UPI00155385C6|nr:hypothetical protein [Campylobacter canadensis]MBZ7994091.1 hypothetical protein [Campylobacter canadensis]MBZ7995906.1 hypothetical protein [Campylobacter canadensis]MBZ7999422.1 hypothetical protein [Campylobacter canadensis]MBZ8001219.1 hypothetical protein [Campylobacter canadensis]MBZ8003748.1 hypothetical protein [Campylobacter canadensis]
MKKKTAENAAKTFWDIGKLSLVGGIIAPTLFSKDEVQWSLVFIAAIVAIIFFYLAYCIDEIYNE